MSVVINRRVTRGRVFAFAQPSSHNRFEHEPRDPGDAEITGANIDDRDRVGPIEAAECLIENITETDKGQP